MNKAESWLEKTLQYRFDDPSLFAQALTHRSADGRNNERLEFLGDAVLDFVISEALFNLRSDADVCQQCACSRVGRRQDDVIERDGR